MGVTVVVEKEAGGDSVSILAGSLRLTNSFVLFYSFLLTIIIFSLFSKRRGLLENIYFKPFLFYK